MRLDEAIALSKVERALDKNHMIAAAAKCCYNQGDKLLDDSDARKKYIISRGWDDYMIVFADTMKPISRNPKLYVSDFEKIVGRDDWEPCSLIDVNYGNQAYTSWWVEPSPERL